MVALHRRDVGRLRDQLPGLRVGRALLGIRARLAISGRRDRLGSGLGREFSWRSAMGFFGCQKGVFRRNPPPSRKHVVSSCICGVFLACFDARCDTIPRLIRGAGPRADAGVFCVHQTRDRNGWVDFGIARWDFEGRAAHTESVVMGSRPYMAPERLDGMNDSPAVDVYSAGMTLYELLTGRPMSLSINPTSHDQAMSRHLQYVQVQG